MTLQNKKAKGSDAERELVHKFWAAGWAAHRIAGSGSNKYPSPDILAGNGARRIAIECKAVGGLNKNLTKKEVDELVEFAGKFGAEAWVGIKFDRMDWLFLSTEDLKQAAKSYGVTIPMAKSKGLSFAQLTES
ncbi:MAG: Holliday junction resolvase Hjc [archaeon]